MKSTFPATLTLMLTACLLSLAGSVPVLAAPAIYDVEVIIFSNSASGDGGENWSGPGGASAGTAAYGGGEFTELSRALYQLDGISNALRQSSGYRVVFHRAWRQAATGRSTAAAYRVSAGDSGVAGSIRLVRERYLHLDVDLRLQSGHAAPVYQLQEKRRIRSAETHYFDHPRFGLIARVTPYAAPDEPDPEPEPEPEPEPKEELLQMPEDDQLTR